MTRLMLCLLVVALPFAAAAQTADPNATDPNAVDPNAPMEVTATQEDAAVAETDKDRNKALDHFCLQHTGSLITARNATASRRCAGIGRSYTQDEIRRTGETNIADALRRLDASIY